MYYAMRDKKVTEPYGHHLCNINIIIVTLLNWSFALAHSSGLPLLKDLTKAIRHLMKQHHRNHLNMFIISIVIDFIVISALAIVFKNNEWTDILAFLACGTSQFFD